MAKKVQNHSAVETISPFESTDRCDAVIRDIRFVFHRDPNPNWKFSDTTAPDYYVLAYAVSGYAWYKCEGKQFPVSRGQLLFFPRGVARSAMADSKTPWSFISVGFEMECFDEATVKLFKSLPHRLVPSNELEINALFLELERRWTARSAGYLLRCRSIIMHLLYLLLRSQARSKYSTPHAQSIASVVRLLQDQFTHSFSVDELAQMVELSPSRFRVLFKEFTGYTVVKYQNWLRINKAKDLLLSGEYTVTQTAQKIGFEDVYYFSRLFKKFTGNTPSHYREE